MKQAPQNVPLLVPLNWDEMQIMDFLHESNLIEDEGSMIALEDAVLAWNYAYEHRHKIDLDYILEIHRLLGQRIAPKLAGKWRDCDVWIGNQFKPFTSEALIKENMKRWLQDTKVTAARKRMAEQSKETLVRKWHVAYEQVHPFVDINGRSGRILMNIQRLLLGLPLWVIDHRTRWEEYYPLFRDTYCDECGKTYCKHYKSDFDKFIQKNPLKL